jgi:glycosyl hydrolase family 67
VVIIETMIHSRPGSFLPVLLLCAGIAHGLDLKNAVVVTPGGSPMPVQKASQMLQEEVEKRTQVRLAAIQKMPSGQPAILVGTTAQLQSFAADVVRQLPPAPQGTEGFRIAIVGPTVVVAGNSERAVVFGAGYLLRHMDMRRGKILEVADNLKASTAPQVAVRGHQLGYRPKVNAYDAFTVPMFEQYIRDLAVFGTNAIELIPPRSDDADDSPHFPLPKIEMMVEMSRICAEYGLDVWIWFPAMDKDYSNAATVEFALKEWEEVFRRLPRIDHIFVPGGDPGHTQPKYLLGLLEKQTASLHKYHPKASMWVSPQGFSKEWTDEFYELLRAEPKWLAGIVHGPQVRDSIPVLRKMVPQRYPIRRYPDITHSINSQYFVPDWDLSYMVTEGREVANPRPIDERAIFNAYKDYTIGFSTYSEGVNDDVNKFVWSILGWDPNADLTAALAEFGRYFIGDEVGHDFGQGLFALERNWRGPLLTNEGVENTLAVFRDMEKRATPQMKLNWRFQQALYRAYYDAYVRHRLINETDLEQQALGQLRAASRVGSQLAIERARQILDKAVTEPAAADLRARIMELSEGLYQNIHAQLSVEKYQAIAVGRGASSDTVDMPLNNRWWLEERFTAIGAMADETARRAAIDEIVNRTDPGPGGFYDDLGDLSRQPHLVRGPGYPSDPAYLESSYVGIGRGGVGRINYVTGYATNYPRSWLSLGAALNDTPVKMRYEGLDPQAQYKIRVVYAGGDVEPKLKLVANGTHEIHPWLKRPVPFHPLEFDIPRAATADGKLELTFSKEPGLAGNGRGLEIGEVWLIRKQ